MIRKLLSVYASIAFLASPVASAEGIYIFGSIGESQLEDSQSVSSVTVDDADSAYRVGIGYWLNDNFSLEAGYVDLGEYSATITNNFTGTIFGAPATINANSGYSLDAAGLVLGGKAHVPLSEAFGVYGRAGLYFWESDYSVFGSGTYNGTAISGSVSGKYDDGTDLYFGVGAEYNLSDNVAVSLDYTNYNFDLEAGDADVSVYEVGVSYMF